MRIFQKKKIQKMSKKNRNIFSTGQMEIGQNQEIIQYFVNIFFEYFFVFFFGGLFAPRGYLLDCERVARLIEYEKIKYLYPVLLNNFFCFFFYFLNNIFAMNWGINEITMIPLLPYPESAGKSIESNLGDLFNFDF